MSAWKAFREALWEVLNPPLPAWWTRLCDRVSDWADRALTHGGDQEGQR